MARGSTPWWTSSRIISTGVLLRLPSPLQSLHRHQDQQPWPHPLPPQQVDHPLQAHPDHLLRVHPGSVSVCPRTIVPVWMLGAWPTVQQGTAPRPIVLALKSWICSGFVQENGKSWMKINMLQTALAMFIAIYLRSFCLSVFRNLHMPKQSVLLVWLSVCLSKIGGLKWGIPSPNWCLINWPTPCLGWKLKEKNMRVEC